MYYFLPDSENCISSRGQGEVSSAESFSDIPPYVLSRLNLTAGKSYCNGNEMEYSHGSQSGMMCEHLTGSHGEGLPMLCAEVSPARTLALPGKVRGLEAHALGFGQKCGASFAKLSPDMSSWRTHQCLLLGGLALFSETWPRWGMMQSGECWALPTLEPRTCANEFGLWPTVCKFDQTKTMPHKMEIRNGRPTTISSKGKTGSSPLRAWAAVFPTGSLKVGEHWPPEPGMARMVHGVANGVDRIGAIGNGQVPIVAATAWRILT